MDCKRIVVLENQTSIINEAFRAFRTNLLYSKVNADVKSILFTSAVAGEGKSIMVANTAIALALTGKKVIILDCDLRKPVQYEIFEKKNRGLTNYISRKCTIEDIVQDTDIPNLSLIASGPPSFNPSELLDSNKTREVISVLKNQADYLIVDSPPVLPVADACILGSKMDGIILVVGAGIVRPAMAKRAKERLETANGNILGLIINRSETYLEQSGYYQYYGKVERAAN